MVSTIVTAVVEYSIGLTRNERKFIIDRISNNDLITNIKIKFINMKELLFKSGGGNLNSPFQYPSVFCLSYNKQVFNNKQEA